jgi:microcystin-dependent protein
MAVLSKVANIAVQPQPVGVVEAFAGTNAPNGWLICDGSQVSRALYPELFSVIGTTYGSGDGFATFTLPDLRGRTIAGRDGVNNMNNGPTNRLTSTFFGASGTALGNSGGNQSHTLTTAQMPSHGHTLGGGQSFGVNFGANAGGFATFGLNAGIINTTTYQGPYSALAEGGNQNHNNTQPTIILNYIIKAVSELPRGGWYNSSSPDLVATLPTNPYEGQEIYHSISGNVFHKRYNGATGVWDKVFNDIIVCTSETRPTGVTAGQQIFETNTGLVFIYNGASWLQMRQTNDAVGISLLPSGSVIQAVQRVSSTSQYVFNNFLYTECYSYITPLLSTSKILVMASASIWTTSSSDGGYGGGIYSNVGGQLIQVSRIGHGFDETGDEANMGTFTYLRSDHNTTSSHYYQLTADPYRNNAGTGVWCNRNFQQTDYSVMTLLEIK